MLEVFLIPKSRKERLVHFVGVSMHTLKMVYKLVRPPMKVNQLSVFEDPYCMGTESETGTGCYCDIMAYVYPKLMPTECPLCIPCASVFTYIS